MNTEFEDGGRPGAGGPPSDVGRGAAGTPPINVTIDAFREALAKEQIDLAGRIATALSPGDLRDALQSLSPEQTAALYVGLGDERLAGLVEVLEPEDAAEVVRRLSNAGAAAVLDELAPDDAADIIGAITAGAPERAQPILVEMDRAGDVQDLLKFLPSTAGGIMTTDFLAVRPETTADQTINTLRARARNGEFGGYVYVTDASNLLLGVAPLYRLILVDPTTPVREIMRRDPISVFGTTDQEDIVRVFRERRLLAVPVVDLEGHLIGVITADDVVDVIEEEATEDIERLGGSQPLDAPYLRSSAVDLVKKRIRWLLVLFLAEAYTGTVLRHFEDELQQAVALTFFIPLLIGTGGNTGTQITTTLTRALAVGDVRPGDVLRVLRKEWSAGALLSVVMAVACLIRAWTLGVGWAVGGVVALTAACIVLWAATVAAVLPLVLRRLRLDPAVVSGPFITTIVDGTGLIIYFEIARYLLKL